MGKISKLSSETKAFTASRVVHEQYAEHTFTFISIILQHTDRAWYTIRYLVERTSERFTIKLKN